MLMNHKWKGETKGSMMELKRKRKTVEKTEETEEEFAEGSKKEPK